MSMLGGREAVGYVTAHYSDKLCPVSEVGGEPHYHELQCWLDVLGEAGEKWCEGLQRGPGGCIRGGNPATAAQRRALVIFTKAASVLCLGCSPDWNGSKRF